MPRFSFVVFGHISVSTPDYLEGDLRAAFEKVAVGRVTVDQVQLVPEYKLCAGSERPAATVQVGTTLHKPYSTGACSSCGVYVPLLSAGNFEVIKHFAPSNYQQLP